MAKYGGAPSCWKTTDFLSHSGPVVAELQLLKHVQVDDPLAASH